MECIHLRCIIARELCISVITSNDADSSNTGRRSYLSSCVKTCNERRNTQFKGGVTVSTDAEVRTIKSSNQVNTERKNAVCMPGAVVIISKYVDQCVA